MCAALMVGFLAGLLSFKVKCRWCPECGATTRAHPDTDDGFRRG
jgi:NADH pyrophosphatase NudC (nudix superfamily)